MSSSGDDRSSLLQTPISANVEGVEGPILVAKRRRNYLWQDRCLNIVTSLRRNMKTKYILLHFKSFDTHDLLFVRVGSFLCGSNDRIANDSAKLTIAIG